MNVTRIRIGRLLRSAGLQAKVPFPQFDLEDYGNDPETLARVLRAAWLLPSGPLRSVTQAIEDAGGIVVRVAFGSTKIDAISEWVPGYPPIFLVNADAEITGDRLRLTLAHEIAHMVMHRLPNPAMEDQANLFAAEFLMPRKEIKGSLYGLTMAKLAHLKRIWKVSMAALVQRAFELGTINAQQRRNLFINLSRRGYKLREPIETDIPIEMPSLLISLARTHLDQLQFSMGDLKRLLFCSDEAELKSVFLGRPVLQAVG